MIHASVKGYSSLSLSKSVRIYPSAFGISFVSSCTALSSNNTKNCR